MSAPRFHHRQRYPAVDLGLELLCCLVKPGRELTQADIAAWCGCTKEAIYYAERNALKKLRRIAESKLAA